MKSNTKTLFSFLVVVCLVGSLFIIQKSNAIIYNAVQNGDFEQGDAFNPLDVPFWTAENNFIERYYFGVVGVPSPPHVLSVAFEYGHFGQAVVYQPFLPALDTNLCENISLYVWATEDNTFSFGTWIMITYSDFSTQYYDLSNNNTGWGGNWHLFTQPLEPNKYISKIELSIIYINTTPTIESYIDDVSIPVNTGLAGDHVSFMYQITPTPQTTQNSYYNLTEYEIIPSYIEILNNNLSSIVFHGIVNNSQTGLGGNCSITSTSFFANYTDATVTANYIYLSDLITISNGNFTFIFLQPPRTFSYFRGYRLHIESANAVRDITFIVKWIATETTTPPPNTTQNDVLNSIVLLIIPIGIYGSMIFLGLVVSRFKSFFFSILFGVNIGSLIYFFLPICPIWVLPFTILLDILLIVFRPKGE